MPKLNTLFHLQNELIPKGVKIDFYFDRISLHLDSLNCQQDITALLNDNLAKNKLLPCLLPQNEFYNQKIEMFQPSDDCLKTVQLKGDSAIIYIEFALDFSTRNNKLFRILVKFMEKHLVHLGGGHGVPHCKQIGDTVYYTLPKKKKRLVLYSDKLSRKHKGLKCLHIEFRVEGWQLVKLYNIFTFDDLIAFDHLQLWENLLDLRVPIFQLLGEAVGRSDISRQMQHRYGKKTWSEINVLQAYLATNPNHAKAFKSMSTKYLIKELGK
jgi:hypothetical protein